MNLKWNNIRSLHNSQNDGFEEFVCQLARKENIPNKVRFIRKGKPDAGVECLWILDDGTEWAWQAKYFLSSLSNNQWAQLDGSVKTVISKHPKVKKYFIAIPIDPPDARLDSKLSTLEKWDKHVDKWERWANDNNLEIKFILWWSSDMIERLQRPDYKGLNYYWFEKEELTDDWFDNQVDIAITNLGNRYTPNLNFELEISKNFNGIARDDKYINDINLIFNDFFIESNKAVKYCNESYFGDDLNKLIDILNQFKSYFLSIELSDVSIVPFDVLLNYLSDIKELLSTILDFFNDAELKIREEKGESGYYYKYGSEIISLRELLYYTSSTIDFIESTESKLINKPFLLIEGDAGIGKSHLIADIVDKRKKENKSSILLLGQHFILNEDPWTQIFKQLKVRCNVDEFLGALEAKAQIQNSRIIIFIDAINEGNGRTFWPEYLKGFIKSITPYKWIGLVLSIRTSYSPIIIPKNDVFFQSHIIRIFHEGFRDTEYEATKLFFNNYNIELPSVPLLHPEFQNPLFLKLFCEGLNKAGYTRIPEGFEGISKIIEFFINAVNKSLSAPNKHNFPEDLDIVGMAVKRLINFKIKKELYYIPFKDAYMIITKLQKEFNIRGQLIFSLESEGIISKNLFWKDKDHYEEGIYIAYERFEDHLIANILLSKINKDEITNALTPKGELYKFFKDDISINHNRGLVDALSIQLPEKFQFEIFELLPTKLINYEICESFVDSLLWRQQSTLTTKIFDFINNHVLRYKGTHDSFFDTIIALSTIPNIILNAKKTHQILSRYSMADRDSWWTQLIHNWYSYNSSLKRLIDWAWSKSDKSHISNESILLASIMISWFLTSTNRTLRDSASKSLVCLLQNRIPILIQLLDSFKDANDPYILERLYGIAYGSALRTNQIDNLEELSLFVYNNIFNKESIYPNILLRDYARGIIEYTLFKGFKLKIDVKKIRPPYKSSFPDSLPDYEEIESKYYIDYNSPDFKQKHYSTQNSILFSMRTNSKNSPSGGYGDFGRYVFQSALDDWRLDTQKLSNWAVMKIFEDFGFNVEKHGEFDSQIETHSYNRNYVNEERIGKKYQWIAFYEILARVADNFPKYERYGFNEKEEEYQGAWEPYIRDFEPSILIKKSHREIYNKKTKNWWFNQIYDNWELSSDIWIKQNNDIPDPISIIEVFDNNREAWLQLETYPEWSESKPLGEERYDVSHKVLWYQLKSYFVKEEDFKNVKKWGFKQNFWGRWMPEPTERYEVFYREYYWSPAYIYFRNNEYYSDLEWVNLEKKDGKILTKAIVSTENYMWEEQYDASKEDTIHIIKPAKKLFESLDMSYSENEGIFLCNNEIICFDPSVNTPSFSCFLIKKEKLIEFLSNNKLRIFWTFIGEKQVIGGNKDNSKFLELSGFYYLDHENIKGSINSKLL